MTCRSFITNKSKYIVKISGFKFIVLIMFKKIFCD